MMDAGYIPWLKLVDYFASMTVGELVVLAVFLRTEITGRGQPSAITL